VKEKASGTDALKPFRAWTNAKRRFKRKIGYESDAGRLMWNGLPRLGGSLVVVLAIAVMATAVFLLVA
jgi:hypothetical protein